MKYLLNFNRYKLNENYHYDNIQIDWSKAENYARENYDFENYFKKLGKDIFDFMSDYNVQRFYDDIIENYIKNTSLEEIAEWNEEILRDYIINNKSDFDDLIDYNEDNEDFDDVVNNLDINEIIKLIKSVDYAEDIILSDEAHFNFYHQSIQEMFENAGYSDEEYYLNLNGYFNEEKAINYFLENEEDEVAEFYLKDIETDDKLKDDLIEYDIENADHIFNILDSKNKYGKSLEFQKKYIIYELLEIHRYNLSEDEIYKEIIDPNDFDDNDMQSIIDKIENKFGLNKELREKYRKYLRNNATKKFNI